jgi:hypothetical protein
MHQHLALTIMLLPFLGMDVWMRDLLTETKYMESMGKSSGLNFCMCTITAAILALLLFRHILYEPVAR